MIAQLIPSEVHLAHLVHLERRVNEVKTEQTDFQAVQVKYTVHAYRYRL